jgi:tetratricopeptide (TPR) repeat protein
MAHKTDYYSILQVSSQATSEDIKLSFRRLARQYHPDLNPDNPETAEQFKQISEAYEILSDEIKRRRYDTNRSLEQKTSYTTYTTTSDSKVTTKVSQAKDFYFRGVAKTKNRQYKKAIKEYSRAIELDPNFVEAYLKRCEMRYKLGDNQGVLDDCYQIIKIKSSVPKAYYYQGRARFSLGYVQSAIDSYSEAIRQQPNYAQVYYHRGIAYRDIKDNFLALEDWQIAADLFHNENNHNAYRHTKKQINSLNKNFNLGGSVETVMNVFNNALITFLSYIVSPLSRLLPAFARLSPSQAIGVGLIYGVSADLCLTVSSYLLAGSPYQFMPSVSYFNVWQILLINFLPFLCLTLMSTIARLINHNQGTIVHDLFLAGTSFLPLGMSFIVIGFIAGSQSIPILLLIILLVFGFSYGILTLYTNCTQILRLPETESTFLVPLITAVTAGCHYLAQYIFI